MVGKIHRHEHLNFILMGDVSVVNPTVNSVMRYKAPNTFISLPNTKRLVFAHEDTIWTTIHVTNETDLSKIEEEVIMIDYNDGALK